MEKCKVDFVAKKVILTAAFEKKMQKLDSEEFNYVMALRAAMPDIQIVSKTHRTPSCYHNKDGSVSSCNQFKNLTYQNMELFISKVQDCQKFQTEYAFVKSYAGKGQRNGYALVRRWFVAQFPQFRKNPLFYVYNTPAVVPASTVIQKAEEATAQDKAA